VTKKVTIYGNIFVGFGVSSKHIGSFSLYVKTSYGISEIKKFNPKIIYITKNSIL
jgi:hypothetical protein